MSNINILFINKGKEIYIEPFSFKNKLSSSIFSPTFITVSLSDDLTINSNYFLLSRYTAFLIDKNNMVIPISRTRYLAIENKDKKAFITNILNGKDNYIGGKTNNEDFVSNTTCKD